MADKTSSASTPAALCTYEADSENMNFKMQKELLNFVEISMIFSIFRMKKNKWCKTPEYLGITENNLADFQ